MLKKILLLFIVLIPQFVFANAGTPLMLLSALQLVFGNAILGLIEGLLVTKLYGVKWYRAVLLMVLGNYVSWIIGMLGIALLQEFFISFLPYLKGVFVAWVFSLVILYFLTVVIERPFYGWIFKKANRTSKALWKLSFGVNACTYTVMISIYLLVSSNTFFTDLTINQSILQESNKYELFLLKDNQLYKGDLSNSFRGHLIQAFPDSTTDIKLALDIDNKNAPITLTISSKHGGVLYTQTPFSNNKNLIHYTGLLQQYTSLKTNDTDFREFKHRHWSAINYSWAADGFKINYENNTSDHFAFEVPWMFWNVRNVSILNDNEMLILISNRLVLLNIKTKEIALVTTCNDYVIRKKRQAID